MPILGGDALGRPALGQASNPAAAQAQIIGDFNIWLPAPRPINFSKDWIAYSETGFTVVPVNKIGIEFTPFSLGLHSHNFSRDWIAFSGNVGIEFPVYTQPFSPFAPPPRPRNFAKDWIAFSGDYFVQTATLSFFIGFSQPSKPPNFAKAWIEYSELGFTIVPINQIGIEFMPFAPGLAAKLWTRFGQQPQWWTYEFKAPVKSKRDRGGGGDWIPRHHRHPSVYSEEYYDSLRKKFPEIEEDDDALPLIERVPNLLIPLNRLIPPIAMPTLFQLPPFRPVPSLTTNPPAFHMTTPEEMAMDDELIIRMLLEE